MIALRSSTKVARVRRMGAYDCRRILVHPMTGTALSITFFAESVHLRVGLA